MGRPVGVRLSIGILVGERRETSRREIEDATCLGCPCLCDDIALVVEGGRVVEAGNACAIGRGWYESAVDEPDEGPTIGGRPAGIAGAIAGAAEVLLSARAPAILGPGATTIESWRALMAIADRVGAFVGSGSSEPFARVGAVGATLGEVRDRADLIVYAGTFAASAMPRFAGRYAEDSRGRFVPEGRSGRTVIRLGSMPEGAPSGPEPDLAIEFDPGRASSFYPALRAIVNGVSLDPRDVEKATGVPLPRLAELAHRLKSARYGAFVYGSLGWSRGLSEAFLALVRDLNDRARFVAIEPRDDAAGRAVSTWQAGYGGDVDLGRGSPRQLAREGVLDRIREGEVDTLLVVGDGHPERLDFPRIVIRPARPVMAPVHANLPGGPEDVCIPAGCVGIDEGGTVARFDGVMLPLRPPFPDGRVSQVEVLRRIEAHLRERGR